MIVLCGLGIGSGESLKLRMRSRELRVLLDALSMLKGAVQYTAGDFELLMHLCSDNRFIACVSKNKNPICAWGEAAKSFFTDASDRIFAESFMDNFGKTDLNGVVAHIALYEQKAMRRLEDAEKDTAAKCRLYTVLGLFTGTAAALLLI